MKLPLANNCCAIRASIVALAIVATQSLFATPASAQAGREALQDIDYQSLFAVVGTMYQIDPGLLKAIARVESAGDPNAISRAGAVGLMQLEPPTAAEFGVEDLFDPVQNTLGAARYIDYLRRHQRSVALGALPAILAAYNAGEKGAGDRGVDSAPAETRRYVRDVLIHYLLDTPSTKASPRGIEARRVRAIAISTKPRWVDAVSRPVIARPSAKRARDREILDTLSQIGEQRKIALERQENMPR
jgi:Transglycosylase SLT domain